MKDRIFSLGVSLGLVVLLLLRLLKFQHLGLDNLPLQALLHLQALLRFLGRIQIFKYQSHLQHLARLSRSKALQPLPELCRLSRLCRRQHPRQTASLIDLNSRMRHCGFYRKIQTKMFLKPPGSHLLPLFLSNPRRKSNRQWSLSPSMCLHQVESY